MRTALRWLVGLAAFAALAVVMVGVGALIATMQQGDAQPTPAGVAARRTPTPSPVDVAALPTPEEVDYVIITPAPSAGSVVGPTIRPGIPSAMPITGDCLACHETPQGGVGTKEIPAMAHPLKGWTSCTSCHDSSRLVKTAPGHSGIHADGCTLCHTRETVAPPMRPHTLDLTQGCLTCHGKDEPLPHSMADRSATNCWLCHQSSPDQAPTTPHHVDTTLQCRSCHEPERLGALPRSHQGWADRTCITCHKQSKQVVPVAPHELSERVGLCSFCHQGASFAPTSEGPEDAEPNEGPTDVDPPFASRAPGDAPADQDDDDGQPST
ncbi:MAG: hypothetical protein U0869_16895 [Chloroflexota bacterium]